MKKKNILIISQVFFPEQFPINLLSTSLKKIGYNIDVITGYPTYPKFSKYFKNYRPYPSISYFKKIKIYRTPIIPRINNSAIILFLNYFSFIFNSLFFSYFFLFKKKVDYIFVYATSPLIQALIGVFIKKIKKTKLVIWVQDLWPESLEYTGYIKNRLILNFIKKIVKFIYNQSDLILVQSESFKKNLEKITNKKIVVLHNPSEDFFLKNKKKVYDKKAIKYLYAGNIGKAQTIEKIVKLAKNFKKNDYIKFKIIGSGSQANVINNLIKKNNLKNIIYKKQKNYNQIKKEFQNADILFAILKKHKLSEQTIPSKIQAYMSTGKPILSCIEGEASNLIKYSKSGFICKNNLRSLKKKIIKINKTKKNKLNNLGKNGRKYFLNNFSANIIANKLQRTLKELND